MSGNQNGEKYSSPLPELIPEFENEVLGYECSTDMRKTIERAFNEWWNYAESLLMPEEMYESVNKSLREKVDGRQWDRMDIILRSMLREMEEGFLGDAYGKLDVGLENMRQAFERGEKKLFQYIAENLSSTLN